MAGVYTPSSIAIQDHSLAIKIHERPPCNFVFTCLYALIRSGIRPIPEFEHFPQWKAAVFVTIHLPRKFSLPGEESWLSAYFSFFHFLHAPARVTTQFTRYLFTFFSLYAKFLVNRATFSHFSLVGFLTILITIIPQLAKCIIIILTRQSRKECILVMKNLPKSFQFSNQLQTRHRNGTTVGCGFSVWLVEIRLSKENVSKPFSRFSDAHPNPIELHGDLISCKISENRGRGNGPRKLLPVVVTQGETTQGETFLVLGGQGFDPIKVA